MNYAELQQAIIEDTHRGDLSALMPRFIRQGEGLIRRDLTAYLLSATFDNTSRAAPDSPVYSLPIRADVIRRLAINRRYRSTLVRVAPHELGSYDISSDPLVYAQLGNGNVEFRGNPGDADTFDILYFGTPAPLVNDDDTNELLTDHESIYMAAAKFFVYQNTQDRELAQDEISVFTQMIDTLNRKVAREINGNSVAQGYNFSFRSNY